MKSIRVPKTFSIIAVLAIIFVPFVMMDGCKVPESIADKSGAQLWGENCIRCHNSPDPKGYSDDQWDAAAEHMRQKAILTHAEITKIRDFLKSAN
jgi:hypothetical protein